MVENERVHTPVLVREVGRLLAPKPGETVVDATVGAGGHAELLAAAIGDTGRLIGLDVDPASLAVASDRLSGRGWRVDLVQANFDELPQVLSRIGVESVDVLLADLGVSSGQIDDASRGFSFLRDGPLDMRMDPRIEVTAADLVNRLSERDLGDLLWTNSQEPGARRIARRICAVRRGGRITSAQQLVRAVCGALGVDPLSRRSRIHPATRTFQALRIAVNDELGALQRLLERAPSLLGASGRFGVISFHSREDRLVKTAFRGLASEGSFEVLTKKPVVANEDERRGNPRSRSAKFRVVRRCP
jgi:16S rRNA (cytosine1402-N4)-methyltransferase